jgi:dienelactone hydrolase
MATPLLIHHTLPGALGPILVDVRTTPRESAMPAVLIHHGFKGFKDFALLPAFADRLARAGFTAVTVSVSGSGVDEAGNFTHLDRFAGNTYSRELDDLGAVIKALDRGAFDTATPTSIGVVGHSRGGGMALCLARETPRIGAVVTWAAIGTARRHTAEELAAWREAGTIKILHQRTRQYLPLNYEVAEDYLRDTAGRFDIPLAAKTLARPWLLVHGTADESVPVSEAYALAQCAADPRSEALYLEGAGHTFGTAHPWAGPTADSERLFDATTRFLTRYLE